MTEFHLLRPWVLLAVIPLILLLWKIKHNKPQLQAWLAICDSQLLQHLTTHTGTPIKHYTLTVLAAIGLLLLFALSGPTWSRLPQPVYKQQQTRVIVLDLSRAMLGQDIKPSRLTRAKFLIRDLLKLPDIGQLGMVAFTQEGFTVSPLTEDGHTIAALVDELSPDMMPIGGGNIAAGLKKAGQLIEQAGDSKGQILLLTANPANNQAKALAKKLAGEGILVDVIGMGTKVGAPVPTDNDFIQARNQKVISHLPSESLAQLAAAGNGSYLAFEQLNSIKQFVQHDVNSQFLENKDNKINTWKDQGRLLLFFLLPLFLVLFRRGWLEKLS